MRRERKEAGPAGDGLSSVCKGFMPYSKQTKVLKHAVQLASIHAQ